MSNRISSITTMSLVSLGLWTVASLPALAQGYTSQDLLTMAQDSQLSNPWGISMTATSPFWVSDNNAGVSTLYSVNPTTNVVTKQGLVVTIPGDGTPSGQVANSTTAFNGDKFIFDSEDGTISGWRGALGTTAETLQAGSTANVYKGLAIASIGPNTYLYAANFRTGNIDVLPSTGAPSLTGNFTDPSLPAGYAPFNIQKLGNTLYVTYALQDGAKHDDVAGLGNGFVDAYDLNGNLLGRIGSNGALDSPWGLAIAPNSFGSIAGDLLVGNFGDGQISIFNQNSDTYLGQLSSNTGVPFVSDGLWALAVGNGASAGSSSDLYFTAGPDGETGGVFEVITPQTPEPGSIAMLGGLALSGALFAQRRRRSRLSKQ